MYWEIREEKILGEHLCFWDLDEELCVWMLRGGDGERRGPGCFVSAYLQGSWSFSGHFVSAYLWGLCIFLCTSGLALLRQELAD